MRTCSTQISLLCLVSIGRQPVSQVSLQQELTTPMTLVSTAAYFSRRRSTQCPRSTGAIHLICTTVVARAACQGLPCKIVAQLCHCRVRVTQVTSIRRCKSAAAVAPTTLTRGRRKPSRLETCLKTSKNDQVPSCRTIMTAVTIHNSK